MATDFNDFVAEVEREYNPAAKAMDAAYKEYYAERLLELLDVPEALAAVRKAQRLTQKQLAERARVEQALVSRLERGQGNPTIETVTKVSKALGLRLALVDTEGRVVTSAEKLSA